MWTYTIQTGDGAQVIVSGDTKKDVENILKNMITDYPPVSDDTCIQMSGIAVIGQSPNSIRVLDIPPSISSKETN